MLLHRLTVLDLSYNNFTGNIPVQLSALDRLSLLRLEWNQFYGSLPPFNQSFLVSFNVSGNNLTGPIPVTPTLSKFDTSSFSLNPDLCGEIINKACTRVRSPFFDSPLSSSATSPAAPLGQSAQAEGGAGLAVLSPSSSHKHRRTTAILGFAAGVSVLIVSLLCIFFSLVKKQNKQVNVKEKQPAAATSATANSIHTNSIEDAKATRESGEVTVTSKTQEIEVQKVRRVEKSGGLVFCGEKRQMYTLEHLMRASAELLGRGTMGTTYKAVLDNQLIVTVKRLDASKSASTSSDAFEGLMEALSGLRHPKLVPIMAYFQAKGERLVIYDYQPNGSLFNLIHGIFWISRIPFAVFLSFFLSFFGVFSLLKLLQNYPLYGEQLKYAVRIATFKWFYYIYEWLNIYIGCNTFEGICLPVQIKLVDRNLKLYPLLYSIHDHTLWT